MERRTETIALHNYAKIVHTGESLYIPDPYFKKKVPKTCSKIKARSQNGYFMSKTFKGAKGLTDYFIAGRLFYEELNSVPWTFWLKHFWWGPTISPFRDYKEIQIWEANLLDAGWQRRKDTVNNTLNFLVKSYQRETKYSLKEMADNFSRLPLPRDDVKSEIINRNTLIEKLLAVSK